MLTRARVVLAIGLTVYLGLLAAASLTHGPRLWGLHLIGFLPQSLQITLWITMFAALALVVAGTMLGNAPRSIDAAGQVPAESVGHTRRWALPIFLAIAGLLFWTFRARTQFLGDGTLWLSGLRTGESIAGHEPLAEAVWVGLARVLHSARIQITPATVAPFSVACGLAAMALTWGLARELTRGSRQFALALALLATTGIAQLFFGYIESYPPVVVAILAFLYVGLRSCRASSSPFPAGIVLALAIASHLGCVYLLPAYVYLVMRREQALIRKMLQLFLPLGVAVVVMLLLGYGPNRWLETLRIVASGVDPHAAASAIRQTRPYSILSWDHALDLANQIALVIPVPLLLLCARIAVTRPGFLARMEPRDLFLGAAAASGILTMCVLVFPVAAAQDWDLFSLFLIPAGVLGVCVGLRLLSERGGTLVSLGMAFVGASTLASFVLVNASPTAGVRRFETLIGDEARISPFARTYGYEALAYYHRHQGDPRAALWYAEALVRSEPTNSRFWALAGALRLNQRDFAGAIPYLEEAIARGRTQAGTWTNLGICYAHAGRHSEALEQFRTALAKEPDRPDYRVNLALALINVGKPDSARVLLIQTVRRWPRYTPALEVLARQSRIHDESTGKAAPVTPSGW